MPGLPPNFGGQVTAQFEKVDEAFRKNFSDGWELEGAAFAVYYKGELVVDLWGGYADSSCPRIWAQDTMSLAFSSSKSLCSLAIAKLVDTRRLKYDDLVTKHWPEFGQNGKEHVTVKMLISHQAGLAAVDVDITMEHFTDWQKMAAIFEKQSPNWTIDGKTFGYHGITHGFLVDQLIRRCDEHHRSVGQFIQEELIKPTGKETFYLGLPETEHFRVARLTNAGLKDALYHASKNKEIAKMAIRIRTGNAPALTKRAFSQPKFLFEHMLRDPNKYNGFNNPDIQRLEIGSANGICTARGLAQPFNALVMGKLLSNETCEIIKQPVTVEKMDKVIGIKVSGGHGFAHTRKPNQEGWMVGHPGHGGQNVKADFENELAFAYITNSLKSGMGDYLRTFARLQKTVYACLDQRQIVEVK